jgi:hypothetical protein
MLPTEPRGFNAVINAAARFDAVDTAEQSPEDREKSLITRTFMMGTGGFEPPTSRV